MLIMPADNEHNLRRRVERHLGRHVSDTAWAMTKEQQFVSEALHEPSPDIFEEICRFLAGLIRLERAAARNAMERSRRAGLPSVVGRDLGPRIEAISWLAAADAADDAEVLRFRDRVLGRTSPMTPDEAEAFLEDAEARRSRSGLPFPALEGLVPEATPFTLRLPQRWHATRPRRVRVEMNVDLWMPAATVLRAYRDLQRKVLPGHNRQVSPRSAELVSFVEQNRPASWPALVGRWNTEHPTRPYADFRTLRTAYLRARQSLVEPGYVPYLGPDGPEGPRHPRAKRVRSQTPIATATSGQTRSASPSRRRR